MNWLELYRPKILSDFKINKEEIQKAIKWIENYKLDSVSSKKVLFIIGNTGIGKTLLGDLILNDYDYQKVELNSSDLRSQKKIGDFLKKSLTYKNVIDMFYEGKKPIGILMDEIDTICKLNDKGGFTEFLDILKQNDKFQTLKKNIADKKKVKKTKILPDNYIKLYNPIICTSNDINDKKINELKKFSEVIHLKKPTNSEMIYIIDDIYKQNNQTIDESVKCKICEYSQYDIRRLIILLENLYYLSNGNNIDDDLFEKYKKAYEEKQEDVQLIESTKRLFTEKMDVTTSQIYFNVDCLLTPLMVYHNSINYIKNLEDTSKKDSSVKKLSIYKNVLKSLCIHDTIQTNIFEVQDWDELYDIASIYGATIPNYYFNKFQYKKNTEINIEFTSLLNKISQMYVNKKLLNSAKFSIGKINFDTDEIIYLTEIISTYFDKYKENINDCDEDEEDENEDGQNEQTEHIGYKKPLQNNSQLITFMNKYHINIDGLENILKIEKLNQISEKRKKKFTLKIKKEISNFLTTQI
jgi:hypothetical protein